MEYWLSALFTFMQFFAMIVFYDAFFERRVRKEVFWGIGLIFFVVSFCFVTILHIRVSLIKIIGCIISFLLMNMVAYQGILGMRFLITILGYSIIYMIGFLSNVGSLAVFHISFDEFVNNKILYVIVIIGTNLFIILLALWFRHIHKPRAFDSASWAVVPLMFPIASLALLFPLYFVFYRSQVPLSILLICVTALVCANIGIVILVDWMEQSTLAREQALAMSVRLAAQAQSVEALSAAYAEQRKMTHDFRQHLAALSGMLSQKSIPAATQYIDNLQREQTERILFVNTHHASVDAVLNQKAQYAKTRGIDIQFKVNDLSSLRIRDIDCTVVLANLLDNAIEACMKLDQPKRWVMASILLEDSTASDGGILCISVLNACPLVTIVNGSIGTTKKNADKHGFGLPNIHEVLSRYSAESTMRYRDNTFLFSIEWPNISP